MIENHSDNVENPEKLLEDNLSENTSDSTSKNNIDTDENIEVDSEFGSKQVKENPNNSEDVLNTVARLEQLEKEHHTLKNQYVRIAADFDNFRINIYIFT